MFISVHTRIVHTGMVRKQCFDSLASLTITTVETRHHGHYRFLPFNKNEHSLDLHTKNRHTDCKQYTSSVHSLCSDVRYDRISAARN